MIRSIVESLYFICINVQMSINRSDARSCEIQYRIMFMMEDERETRRQGNALHMAAGCQCVSSDGLI